MHTRKPSSPKGASGFDRDMRTFEKQPAKTKALARLKERAEKSVGPEAAVVNKQIRAKADAEPRAPGS